MKKLNFFIKISKPKIFNTDSQIDEELEIWKKSVYLHGNRLVGRTLVRLEQSSCTMSECLMGNFVTDAMVFWVLIISSLLFKFTKLICSIPNGHKKVPGPMGL